MEMSQSEKLQKAASQVINLAPVALIYYDESNGKIHGANNMARKMYKSFTGAELLEKNMYDGMLVQDVIERMKRREQFEFYANYDEATRSFKPVDKYQKIIEAKTLLIINFIANDDNGNYITSGLIARKITPIQQSWLQSELEKAKFSILQEMYGMTELRYDIHTKTLDMRGGRDNYDLLGVPIAQLINILHPEDQELFLNKFDALNDMEPAKFNITVRVHSFKLKGYRYFKLEFFPQMSPDNHLLHYLGFCVDVTDEKLALLQKMEEIDRLKTGLTESSNGDSNLMGALANISHDLRSPLGVILGFCDLMAASKNPHKRAEYNKIIQDTGNHMLSMINNILDLNNLETGNLKIHPSEFDLERLLDGVYVEHQLQFQSKNLSLDFKSHGQEVSIYSDQERIMEIIENFVSNALKHTNEGGVTLSYEDNADDVVIHVIDTGIGISEENCKKVFKRFETLDSKHKGHGLGLNICLNLSKALGGEIGVNSEVGKGCDFWIKIPKIYKSPDQQS